MLAPRIQRRVLSLPATTPRPILFSPSILRLLALRHSSSTSSTPPQPDEPPDHRKIGRQQQLFTTSPYSPGSPIFLPAGTRIFSRLVDLLRAQYVRHGFQEVITPNMYKTALWETSGHLQNYAAHMYGVTGGVKRQDTAPAPRWGKGRRGDDSSNKGGLDADDRYSLKPMNCPGHCLVFDAAPRSYRDLPLRLADFGALHRNEVAGALTGLTRVRRFHQDDGHVFCRPTQVRDEIARELALVRDVYRALQLDYRLALSTRPGDGKMLGDAADWDRAEGALREALESSAGGTEWTVSEGDGAFYGPKIDVIVRDELGKEHQTATIQLDFQLPRRFGLKYEAPAPELEARGLAHTASAEELAQYGDVTPVLVHRAVLGSVERMMALLMEKHGSAWPFWLNPRQVAVLSVSQVPEITGWAQKVRDIFLGIAVDGEETTATTRLVQRPTGLAVEYDDSAVPLGGKIRNALLGGVGAVCVVGKREAENKTVKFSGRDWEPRELVAVFLDMVHSYAAEWDRSVVKKGEGEAKTKEKKEKKKDTTTAKEKEDEA